MTFIYVNGPQYPSHPLAQFLWRSISESLVENNSLFTNIKPKNFPFLFHPHDVTGGENAKIA